MESLLLDVIGDNLDVIGSSPTAPRPPPSLAPGDSRYFAIRHRVPASVRDRMGETRK
jgi:glycerate-2-kinase